MNLRLIWICAISHLSREFTYFSLIHIFLANYEKHDLFICATWLICTRGMKLVCDVTHSHAWHDSNTRVIWLSHMCEVTHSCVWRDSLVCVTWLVHMWDGMWQTYYLWHDSYYTWYDTLTHSYMWRDPFICGLRYDSYYSWHDAVIHSYMSRDPSICEMWHDSYYMWCNTLTHSYVWRDSFIYVAWPIHMWNVTWLILHVM